MSKPYSQACENNKQPILSVIKQYFKEGDCVLEIGSGTTQHIRFFAEQIPDVRWQPCEIEANFNTLVEGLKEKTTGNILEPMVLNAENFPWPTAQADGVFSANCLHIMSFQAVKCFFDGLGQVLNKGGYLCVYGPFKYNGEFTSGSNANFDLWLKDRDPKSGVRDFENIITLAKQAGLEFVKDHVMPANNQLLVWQKI